MTAVRKFSTENLDYERFHGPPGRLDIAKVVKAEHGSKMAGDVIVFEDIILEYEMPYDDIMYVLEGELTIATSTGDVVGGPGDILWVPNGETVTFRATRATKVFCATFPVNWEDMTYLGKS